MRQAWASIDSQRNSAADRKKNTYPSWDRPDGTPVLQTKAPLEAGETGTVYYNAGATNMNDQSELLMLTGING
eukprot:248919-Prorocentrum_minimum.AAC.1